MPEKKKTEANLDFFSCANESEKKEEIKSRRENLRIRKILKHQERSS